MIAKVYGPDSYTFIGQVAGRVIMRASTGRLWTVWRYDDGGGESFAMLCAYSDDNGETWSAPEEIFYSSAKTGGVFNLVGAIDSGDNLHIAYQAYDLDVYPEFGGIYYRKRTDGVGWESEEIVDESPYYYCYGPTVAVDSSDNVHVVYGYAGDGIYEVRHRERIGGSWEDPEVLFDYVDNEPYPALAVGSDDVLHVAVVVNYYIRYKTKSSGVWGDEEIVYGGTYVWSPVMTLDSNDVPHVAWTMWGGDADKHFYSYRTGVDTWSDAEVVWDSTDALGDFLSIAADRKDDVYIAWTQYQEGVEPGEMLWCRVRKASGWDGDRMKVFPQGYAY